MSDIEIRPAAAPDLTALTEIYNHYVTATPITFDVEPFTPETRKPWLDQFAEKGPYRLQVAARADRVLGYACSVRFRPKPAYRTSVETSVYLAPDSTGRGLGRRLYGALFEALRGEELNRAYAGITLPNPASVALHQSFGFRSIGVYHEVGHKLGRYWDVEWFEKRLD